MEHSPSCFPRSLQPKSKTRGLPQLAIETRQDLSVQSQVSRRPKLRCRYVVGLLDRRVPTWTWSRSAVSYILSYLSFSALSCCDTDSGMNSVQSNSPAGISNIRQCGPSSITICHAVQKSPMLLHMLKETKKESYFTGLQADAVSSSGSRSTTH